MLIHITFLFSRSTLLQCNKLYVGWEWMNEIFMPNHMAYLHQFNSHHNEPSYSYPISFTIFCSHFAAYIRRNSVSYCFDCKFFMLNAASNRDGLYSAAIFLFHNLKNNTILSIVCIYFHWNAFFCNPVCYLVRNHFIHVNSFRTMSSISPPPRYSFLGNFLRDKI